MKLAAAAFFAALIYAHALAPAETIPLPLSLFRDGPFQSLGYALFAVLALIAVIYIADLVRFGQPGEAAAAGFVVVLIAAIALTPSLGLTHGAAAAAVLAGLFAYFALLLSRSGSPLKLVHLAMPLLILAVTQFHSYGLWQKSLIAYFVAAATIHHHLVRRARVREAGLKPDALAQARQRRIYHLDPAPADAQRS